MSDTQEQSPIHGLTLDQKTIDVLVANIIPTSKYFESRFDNLQYQINEIKDDIKNLATSMDKRFTSMQSDMDRRFTSIQSDMDKRFTSMQSDMDKRFTSIQSDMDKRFEQVDKRFEQVDARFVSLQADIEKRFQQVDDKLDKLIDRIDRRIDEGLRENRNQMMRMFTFAMTFSAISMIGLIGKMLKLF
jgi:ElaB/YqjD/DUF883 family membrane-anchored ribosome-binding protein